MSETRTDTERLDWLDKQVQAVGSPCGTEHIANAWGIEYPSSSIREAIDVQMDAAERPKSDPSTSHEEMPF